MPKLRTLAGEDVIKIFEKFGFRIVSQRGSHAKLQRLIESYRQTITVPQHPELDKGTLKAVYRQALRYMTEPELEPHFYSE